MNVVGWEDLAAKYYDGLLPTLSFSMAVPCTTAGVALAHAALLDASKSVYFTVDQGCAAWPVFDALKGDGLRMQIVARDARRARAASARLLPLVVSTVEMLGEARGARPLHIVYVDDTTRRYLPSSRAYPVMPGHINGGITSTARIVTTVIVYRREDAAKVMIHELLHAFRIDEAIRARPAAEATAVAAFGVRQQPPFSWSVGLGEAYTETLACFLTACAFNKGVRAASEAADALAVSTLAHFGRNRMLQGHGPPIVEGTHLTAYVMGRAALLRPRWLRLLLATYPPQRPPTDANKFCSLLIAAAADWDSGRTRPSSSSSYPKSLAIEKHIVG